MEKETDDLSARLATGIREGWIMRPSSRKPGPARPRQPAAGTPSSEEIITDDRGTD